MSRLTICALFGLSFLAWGTTRTIDGIQYGRQVNGHLALAASANSIDLAKQQMQIAVHNMEDAGTTTGFTSVLWTDPSEDVGFWYSNLKSSLTELNSVTSATSELERSNILLKLHQTVTAHKSQDADVFSPDGISVFPNNVRFALWGWGSAALFWAFLLAAVTNGQPVRLRRRSA